MPDEDQTHGPDATFKANLDAFGTRAWRLGVLLATHRISADACFRALTQLWIQLAHAQRECDACDLQHDRVSGSDNTSSDGDTADRR